MFRGLSEQFQLFFARYSSQFLILTIGLFLLFSQCGILPSSPHVAAVVDCPSAHTAHHSEASPPTDFSLIEHHVAPFGALGMITYFTFLFVVTALAGFIVVLDRQQFWILDSSAFSSWLPPPLLFGFVGVRSFQPTYLPRAYLA